MNTLENRVRERLELKEDDEVFVWFVDQDMNPIQDDTGIRLVYCKGQIRYWDEIFS
jgi:hypothetical protein